MDFVSVKNIAQYKTEGMWEDLALLGIRGKSSIADLIPPEVNLCSIDFINIIHFPETNCANFIKFTFRLIK